MKIRRFYNTIVRAQAIESTLVICGALLLLASFSALAQDNRTITLNDVRDAIYRATTTPPNPLVCVGFYDNICGAGYNGSTGWRVSDHSPAFEYSPAMQFTALKSGLSSEILWG